VTITTVPGHWPSRWPAEDGGPVRRQAPLSGGGLGIEGDERLVATWREATAATMVVLRDPGECYLLRHTGGDDAVSWVERIDPDSLDPLARSPDLAGGPTWPGGLAAHANGSVYVVFGRHAHRLAPDTTPLASRRLPRNRPYNSFVILPDGCLALKDFAGVLPPGVTRADEARPSELLVLEPEALDIVARLQLPEPSMARLSADGGQIYAVGDTSMLRVHWDGDSLHLDDSWRPRYRTMPGQTYGWDPVIDAGAAWFLDNGEGSDRYIGTLRGRGTSTAPQHLVRVDLGSGAVSVALVCDEPGALVANPPAIDPERRIAVGYDSGNGIVSGLSFDEDGRTAPLWRRQLNHGCHPLRFPDTGELLVADHDLARGAEQLVVLNIETGEDRARVDTGSPVQSVLFPCPGFGRDVYLCSFTTVTRVTVAG
jgi:hypothetical protein